MHKHIKLRTTIATPTLNAIAGKVIAVDPKMADDLIKQGHATLVPHLNQKKAAKVKTEAPAPGANGGGTVEKQVEEAETTISGLESDLKDLEKIADKAKGNAKTETMKEVNQVKKEIKEKKDALAKLKKELDSSGN